MAKISVFGIGYVGVVSAACLARDGHQVTAVDILPSRVDTINAGRSPIVEYGLDEVISAAVTAGKLTATLDAEAAIRATEQAGGEFAYQRHARGAAHQQDFIEVADANPCIAQGAFNGRAQAFEQRRV